MPAKPFEEFILSQDFHCDYLAMEMWCGFLLEKEKFKLKLLQEWFCTSLALERVDERKQLAPICNA